MANPNPFKSAYGRQMNKAAAGSTKPVGSKAAFPAQVAAVATSKASKKGKVGV